jgi:hypothetical protein
MPYDDADATDPMHLVGVGLSDGPGAMRRMAAVIAEEYARIGFDPGQLLRVFENPFYAGAHRAYLALGRAQVAEIVERSVREWGICARVEDPRSD